MASEQSVHYGVRCTMTDGEQTLVTMHAPTPDDAVEQVRSHVRIFYGAGDAAGRWLASKRPQIAEVHEAKPLEEWG